MKCKECELYDRFCYHCEVSGEQHDEDFECDVPKENY